MDEKVAIYCRVSTTMQAEKGQSLDAQEKALRKYAKSENFVIVDVFIDDGFSAKNFNRPRFKALERLIKSGKVDGVLIYDFDRLSRDMFGGIAKIYSWNSEYGVWVYSYYQNQYIGKGELSDYDGLSFFFNMHRAESERKKIAARVKMGMKEKVEKGYYMGGRVLGYDSVNKKLVINEDERVTVERIYKLRALGKGYKAIVNDLNENGYKTKGGKKFAIATVKDILVNRVYIGKVSWGKMNNWNEMRRRGKGEPLVEKDGLHEAIISLELWNKVQAINELNRRTRSRERDYNGKLFLSGIVRCPECGGRMQSSGNRKRKYLYYQCAGNMNKGRTVCKANLTPYKVIEDEVEKVIKILMKNKSIVDELVDRVTRIDEERLTEIRELEKVARRKMDDLSSKKERVIDDYMSQRLSVEAYNSAVTKIESLVEEVTETLTRITMELIECETRVKSVSRKTIMNLLGKFDIVLEKANTMEKKSICRKLFGSIKVNKERNGIEEIEILFPCEESLGLSKVRRTVSQVVLNSTRVVAMMSSKK